MKIRILTAALILAGLCTGPVSAQSGAAGVKLGLTLDRAIEIALSENPTIQVADLEIRRQDYVRKETLGNLYPSLSATGSYSYALVKQEMAKGLSFGSDHTLSGTANLSLPLFAPAVYASLKLNRSQMESAVEAARSSKITLVNSVRKSYYGILLAQQSLEVLFESREMISKTVDNTRLMFENELASEYDYLTAQVQLSNLEPIIIETGNALEISKLMLRMLLGIPQDVEFIVTGDLDSHMEGIMLSATEYTTDTSGNSDLRALDIQAQMLQQQIKLINTQRMPVLAAYGTISYIGTQPVDLSGLTGGPPTDTSGLWWQHPASVGLQLSVPIFAGNKNVNQIRQVRNAASQLKLQRGYLEESVRLQVRSAVNNVFAAREKMYANENTVRQAQKAYDISQARYNAGMGTILELNSAELSLTQARLNYSQAVYDLLSAQADYEKTVGREYGYGTK